MIEYTIKTCFQKENLKTIFPHLKIKGKISIQILQKDEIAHWDAWYHWNCYDRLI